ncbi:MAG: glycosyltransferase [Acidobacteria bacterium]|nr:glycosyltransferase [Acidobacteriota bacterium]
MHVLQLGPYPPPEGGISRNMLAIREALRERGGRCSIIATSRSSRMEPEPDVYRPSGAYELVRLLSKLDYDILHLHVGGDLTNRVTGLMLACAFRGRGKSVLTFHSGGYAQENVELARPFSKAGFAFRSFDRIIGVNPLMIRMFEKFGVGREKLSLILPFSLKSPDRSVEIPANIAEFVAASDPFLLTVCLLEDAYDLHMQIDSEALHLGTPVIATDNGMRPEGVNLIPIHDLVALVREIFSVAREVRKQEPRNPDCSDNINDVIRIYEDLLG